MFYLEEAIKSDYDKGYTLDGIAERYKISQEIDYGNKISKKKAYEKVCEVIYNFVMERGCIVKRGDENGGNQVD